MLIGHTIYRYEIIDSSNNELKRLSDDGAPDGSILIAGHQLNGKGQGTNIWVDEPGKNLLFSILLKPLQFTAKSAYILNMAVCQALVKTAANFSGAELKIKWPNDIYCHSNKLAGVLIENTLNSKYIKQSIIGIGFNINQIEFNNTINAISLKMIEKIDFDLNLILNSFISIFDSLYLSIIKGNYDKIKLFYNENLMFMNESILIHYNNTIFEAKLTGVNENGQLQVLKNGEELLLDHGDAYINMNASIN